MNIQLFIRMVSFKTFYNHIHFPNHISHYSSTYSLCFLWNSWSSNFLIFSLEFPISFLVPFSEGFTELYHLALYLYLYFYCNFFKKLILFIYFWLHWVFVAVRRLSLVAASGGYSSLRCAGFSLQWLLLLQSTGSRRTGFSSCGTRASVVVAHGLSSCGSQALERRLSSCGSWA